MRYKLLLLLLFPVSTYAQQGIKFVENATWDSVVALARAENKMIFVDCYASWCVPCKVIDKAVFQSEIAGDYFNQHFISYKVQMDSAKSDSPEKKKYYSEAKRLKAMAEVVNFPTYAFFSPEGKILHRFVGGTQDPKGFIEMAAAAFDPKQQFYSLQESLANERHPDLQVLKQAALAYQRNADYKNGYGDVSRSIASRFVAGNKMNDLLTRENLNFIQRFTSTTADCGFIFFLSHRAAIDSILGKSASVTLIERCIFKSVIDPVLDADKVPSWEHLSQLIHASYPEYADLLLYKARMKYYSKTKDWSDYISVVNEMLDSQVVQINAADLSTYAFEVYLNTKDKEKLKEVVKWTEISLNKLPPTDDRLIIHGSILYASGDSGKALDYLNQAKSLAQDPEKKRYIDATIAKVQANLPLL